MVIVASVERRRKTRFIRSSRTRTKLSPYEANEAQRIILSDGFSYFESMK